jgi:hypothetical protein
VKLSFSDVTIFGFLVFFFLISGAGPVILSYIENSEDYQKTFTANTGIQ